MDKKEKATQAVPALRTQFADPICPLLTHLDAFWTIGTKKWLPEKFSYISSKI